MSIFPNNFIYKLFRVPGMQSLYISCLVRGAGTSKKRKAVVRPFLGRRNGGNFGGQNED